MDQKRRRREVKIYLGRYKSLVREAEKIREEIDRLRDRIDLKSPALTGMPKGGNPYTLEDYVADVMLLIEDLSDNYRKQVLEYAAIEDTIQAVESPLYRLILREHYIAGVSLAGIAKAQSYSIGRMEHLHLAALDAVKLPEDSDS